ncbi:hypothetical protein HY2_06430 [Hyphomonas pacifica]|nr:hypothetical protein HY2_06430 [Hyphomonas pacifica]
MNHPVTLSRFLSVIVIGVLAAAVFAMILAPQPSIYAG